MTDARDIPDAVLWSEGMLLLPQHFQQTDLRTRALLAYAQFAANPYAWGVLRLGMNAASLAAGMFTVTELEAILPDGLPVAWPADKDAPPLALDLARAAEAMPSGTLAIHLVVAPQRLAAREGDLQRYRQIAGPPVADETIAQEVATQPVALPRLVPMLGLQASEDVLRPPEPYVSLPLAMVGKGPTGFALLPFEPPRLRLDAAAHHLLGIARGIVEDLRSRANLWQTRLRGVAAEGGNGGSEGVATLRALLLGVPRLEALLASEVAHPFEVFLTLCDIAGGLVGIGTPTGLRMFEPYQHRHPLIAYRGIEQHIRAVLRELRSPYRVVPFARTGPGRFERALAGLTLGADVVVGVRPHAGQGPAAAAQWFRNALIGAADRIPTMQLNRVNGAAREAIERAPELDLVPTGENLLFRVAADPTYLDPEGTLQISLPVEDGQAEPAELLLYLPPAGGTG